MVRLRSWLLLSSLVGLTIVACSSGNTTLNGANPDGGGPGASSPDGSSTLPDGATGSSEASTTTAATATCGGVLECAQKCPDNDDPCVQRCLDLSKGTSRDKASALYKCILDNACADPDCTETKCANEIKACLGDVSDPGTTPTTPTTGSVPAGMVGTWQASTTVWTFETDGQTISLLEIDSSLGTCSYKTTITTSGVTTASATNFVYHRETGTQTFKQCTTTSSSTMPAADINYQYELGTFEDGSAKLTIHLVSSDGTVASGTDFHH